MSRSRRDSPGGRITHALPMALQPAQGVRAAGVDQPPDRGEVGADVTF